MTLHAPPAQAIVVGAGIIGCAVAHALCARGVACSVLDDRPAGGGATQASAGMLAPYVEAHEAGPLLALGLRSLALYDDWIAAVSRDARTAVEYRRIGTLEVALDAAGAADLRARQAPFPPRTWLDSGQAQALAGGLGSCAGALFTPIHGYASPPALTAALAAAAASRGATFLAGRVLRISRADGALRVDTDRGSYRARHVVLAAGAWTSSVAIDGAEPPPIRPVRGQILHLQRLGAPLTTIVWGPACYLVPREDGTLLVGATMEEAGFDERPTAAGVRALLDAACTLLADGGGASFLGVRVGLRPATPDGLPVLGPDPRLPGLVHAAGHFRNGVLLAPVTARILADWIVGGVSDSAFDTFTVERFR